MLRIICTLLLALPNLANGAEWKVDFASSSVKFAFKQMGASIEGQFQSFESQITFDPNAPLAASVQTIIDVASADSRNPQRDAGIVGKDWFDKDRFPKAVFTSKAFEPTGQNSFDVKGTLEIRNIAKDIVLPMQIDIEGRRATAVGEIELDRRDFGLGQGDWAADKVIGYPVQVVIHIEADESR